MKTVILDGLDEMLDRMDDSGPIYIHAGGPVQWGTLSQLLAQGGIGSLTNSPEPDRWTLPLGKKVIADVLCLSLKQIKRLDDGGRLPVELRQLGRQQYQVHLAGLDAALRKRFEQAEKELIESTEKRRRQKK